MTKNSWVLVLSTQNQCYVGSGGRYICNGLKAHIKNPKIKKDERFEKELIYIAEHFKQEGCKWCLDCQEWGLAECQHW